jgi:hypothetical protein
VIPAIEIGKWFETITEKIKDERAFYKLTEEEGLENEGLVPINMYQIPSKCIINHLCMRTVSKYDHNLCH